MYKSFLSCLPGKLEVLFVFCFVWNTYVYVDCNACVFLAFDNQIKAGVNYFKEFDVWESVDI